MFICLFFSFGPPSLISLVPYSSLLLTPPAPPDWRGTFTQTLNISPSLFWNGCKVQSSSCLKSKGPSQGEEGPVLFLTVHISLRGRHRGWPPSVRPLILEEAASLHSQGPCTDKTGTGPCWGPGSSKRSYRATDETVYTSSLDWILIEANQQKKRNKETISFFMMMTAWRLRLCLNKMTWQLLKLGSWYMRVNYPPFKYICWHFKTSHLVLQGPNNHHHHPLLLLHLYPKNRKRNYFLKFWSDR